MDNGKETKTYRFEKDVITHAETNPLIQSFAEWASERYREEFMNIETLAAKHQIYVDMANECQARINKLKEDIAKGEDISNLTPLEVKWIKEEAPGRIKRATFEGVFKAFCNTFNRKDINRRQFRLFIDRFAPK